MQKNGPRRAWKDPEGPRRTQKNRKGPRKQRQTGQVAFAHSGYSSWFSIKHFIFHTTTLQYQVSSISMSMSNDKLSVSRDNTL